MALLDTLRPTLERLGLNHVGVVGVERWNAAAPLAAEAVHPGTRSVVVLGSGGRAHWDAFLAWVAVDPEARLARREHPLDDFTAEALGSLGLDARVVFPTFRAELRLDFMKLAALAGLGAESALGILVSDRWGPWFGLRAALFTPEVLPETFAIASPCVTCSAPCVSACPRRLPGARPFSWTECVDARATTCAEGCAAREACVLAPEERYDDLERRYHHDPARGRRLLLARFGLEGTRSA